MIYLATPYSHESHEIRELRFVRACIVAGQLMKQGLTVFSPIAHTHPIAVRCELPTGWDFWERYDREHIAACSEVLVVKMEGWDRSKGVAAEIEIANALGKRVAYMENPF